jgi:hypothetical protein
MLESQERILSRASRYQVQTRLSARTLTTIIMLTLLSILLMLLAISMLALRVKHIFVVWRIRPLNPRGDSFGFVKWPSSGRTFFWKRPRPQPSKVFEFLQDWLSDPVHIEMIAFLTSGTGPRSHIYKLAEENILWQLSSDPWKHETDYLSTRSKELARQAIEKPNFNTLRQLVQCRRTTRKLQDSSKALYRQMPSMTLDWECAMKDWNHGWHESPKRQSHRPYSAMPSSVCVTGSGKSGRVILSQEAK